MFYDVFLLSSCGIHKRGPTRQLFFMVKLAKLAQPIRAVRSKRTDEAA
jgi:hypothetical protein